MINEPNFLDFNVIRNLYMKKITKSNSDKDKSGGKI